MIFFVLFEEIYGCAVYSERVVKFLTGGENEKVLIIGGGFAGLNAARKLGNHPDVQITLIDRRNHHLFQPLLYRLQWRPESVRYCRSYTIITLQIQKHNSLSGLR